MKKLIFTFLIILSLAPGNRLFSQVYCRYASDVVNYLSGEWEWLKTTGGYWGGTLYTPENSGYRWKLVFNSLGRDVDSVAYSLLNYGIVEHKGINDGIVEHKGVTNIFCAEKIYSGSLCIWALNPSPYENIVYVEIYYPRQDTLYLRESGADTFEHTYVRVKGQNANRPGIPGRQPEIYPNPCHGTLNLKYYSNTGGVARVLIYNYLGQQVFVTNKKALAGANKFQLDISSLPPGGYILSIKDKQDMAKSCKLFIAR